MKDAAELIKAIAELLWPVSLIVFMICFWSPIKGALGRLKHLKVPGLEADLAELTREASSVESKIIDAPPAPALKVPITEPEPSAISEVLTVAAQSPEAGLMLLASEIDREVSAIVASNGLRGQAGASLPAQVESLMYSGSLSTELRTVMQHFRHVRNRLVHGESARREEVFRAIDAGLSIYKALRAIPRETFIVARPQVEIFEDPQCAKPVLGAVGIELLIEHSESKETRRSIFPTSRPNYERGQVLSWEWNMDRVFGPAWYRDQSSGQPTQAWIQSAEFAGNVIGLTNRAV